MKVLRRCSVALARFLLSAMFLVSAMMSLLHWQESEHALLSVLSDWQNYMSFSDELAAFFGALTPWTSLLLLAGALFELGGGLLVLLGIRERFGAGLLLLAFVPATVLFHQFWFIEGGARELQTALFLKNLAIIGGLILVALHGAQSNCRTEEEVNSLRF